MKKLTLAEYLEAAERAAERAENRLQFATANEIRKGADRCRKADADGRLARLIAAHNDALDLFVADKKDPEHKYGALAYYALNRAIDDACTVVNGKACAPGWGVIESLFDGIAQQLTLEAAND